MRARTAELIFFAGCVVALPVSFYGGLALKEHYLSNELVEGGGVPIPNERAMRARILQLAQERNALLKDKQDVDEKILEVRGKMASRA